MKKITLLITSIMLLGATAAFAGGLDLYWNDCAGSGVEVSDKSITCTNNFTGTMIGSFTSPIALPALGGCQWELDLATENTNMDVWWSNYPSNARYVEFINNTTGAACGGDLWNSGVPSVQAPLSVALISTRTLRFFGAQAFVNPGTLPTDAVTNYYNFSLQVKGTLGTLGNAGCNTKACFVWNKLDLQEAVDPPSTIVNTPDVQNFVTWKGASIIAPCPAATPVKKATWGSIKALYR